MESKIDIPIEKYKIISCPYKQHEVSFDGTERFDKECGISYAGNGIERGCFSFKVVDEKKWLLAKIKYGI